MKVKISVRIPTKLLQDIENHIEGKNRSEKVAKCVEAGYKILNGE